MGEGERRLGVREARIMGGVARVAERWKTGQGTPRGGEAQAVEELQRAWADVRRRLERVGRAEREGERHREQPQESGGSEGHPPLQPFRQPAIPPQMEGEVQERAWRQIRDEAARLAERDREVAARGRRVREEEGAVARGGHRVIPDPEAPPPHGCAGTFAVRKGGQTGGRRDWARVEKAAPAGGAGSRGSSGGTKAHQSQPGADDDRLGLRVATTAPVCAAAGEEGSGDSGGTEGGGRGGAGPLREAGREDKGGAALSATWSAGRRGQGKTGRRWRRAGGAG